MSKQYNVAILGATGAVGTRMIEQLAQSTIPVKHVKLLASKKSAGKTLQFKGQPVTVEETTPESFDGVDIVLSSAGGSVSKSVATGSSPGRFAEWGCSETSTFLMYIWLLRSSSGFRCFRV